MSQFGLFGQRTPALFQPGPKSAYSGSVLDYLPGGAKPDDGHNDIVIRPRPRDPGRAPYSGFQNTAVDGPQSYSTGGGFGGGTSGPPSPYDSQPNTAAPYDNSWFSKDSPFMRMKGSLSSMADRVGNLFQNPGNVPPTGNPMGDVNPGAAPMAPAAAPVAPSAPHSMTPPWAYPGQFQGPSGPSANVPMGAEASASGGGGIPMPPPRPDAGAPALSGAMLQAQDPSKIIMYGSQDNPNVAAPNFDWRSLFK